MGRNSLLQDEAYRRWFRADFEKRFSPRVWHRDFDDARITECPDASLVGKSVGDVARSRGIPTVDCFLDMVLEHGRAFRWTTVNANDPAKVANRLLSTPGVTLAHPPPGAQP